MGTNEIQQLDQTVVSNKDLGSFHSNVSSSFSPSISQHNQVGTYEKLNQLFTEQDQEKRATLEEREILGESAEYLTDSQVYDLVNEVQYLVDSWLEEYERQVFEGKTLNELIGLDK